MWIKHIPNVKGVRSLPDDMISLKTTGQLYIPAEIVERYLPGAQSMKSGSIPVAVYFSPELKEIAIHKARKEEWDGTQMTLTPLRSTKKGNTYICGYVMSARAILRKMGLAYFLYSIQTKVRPTTGRSLGFVFRCDVEVIK